MHLVGVGYEGIDLETMVSRLKLHGVGALVDVRLNAISRKKGFSKTALRTALEQGGIRYMHFPQLGNVKENRAGYAQLGTSLGNKAREVFRAKLGEEQAQHAIEQIVEISQTQTVALFCYEKNDQNCHREQVMQAINSHVQNSETRV